MKSIISIVLLITAPLIYTMTEKYLSIYTSTNWFIGYVKYFFPFLLALILVALDFCAVKVRTGSKKEGICILTIGIIQLLIPLLIFTPAISVVTFLNIYNVNTLTTYYIHALFTIILGFWGILTESDT